MTLLDGYLMVASSYPYHTRMKLFASPLMTCVLHFNCLWKTISYHLKKPYPGKTCLALMKSSRIETYVIFLPNPQRLTTFQGWKFNKIISLYFQGCHFTQMIPIEFQGCNHHLLHLHHNKHFDDTNLFETLTNLYYPTMKIQPFNYQSWKKISYLTWWISTPFLTQLQETYWKYFNYWKQLKLNYGEMDHSTSYHA